jgi:hypothetical protein
MATEHDANYYQSQLQPVLHHITDPTVRIAVNELLKFARKKELGTASNAHQTIKPGIQQLEALKRSINLSHIENTAGSNVKQLVERLILYIEQLIEQA